LALATPDAVLVIAKGHEQDVKIIVEELKPARQASATQVLRVHRPWGFYLCP
jgi:mannose-1-phosphate guanylyltransferase/mannose-1-phosphate guanylyltransferase/mannose-6-phosphate isomerase